MIKKPKETTYYEGIGRRKTAVARVRLYIVPKNKEITVRGIKMTAGQIILNGKDITKVFGASHEKQQFLYPLRLVQSEERFAVSIISKGGGRIGQLEAIVLGISRALELVDKEAYRPTLKKEGLLTRDPRARQRRHVGTGGKARRAKQSPKR